MPEAQALIVGIDIGGTFTDFVLYEPESSTFHLHKLLTTPSEPARCVIEGLGQLLKKVNAKGDALSIVIHGTTLVTNAIIERKGARTALLATEGFRDILEIGTELRYDPYNLFMEKPQPLVPRQLRYGVRERVDNEGREIRPLDLEGLKQIAAQLEEQRVQSVAICFMHSFRNAAHEEQAGLHLQQDLPGLSVSLSSHVAPEIREYFRMSTTAANAYVKPLVNNYLTDLSADLQQLGYQRPLYLMLSSGGITTADIATEYPIRLLESGPAGGALFTAYLGRLTGRSRLISFDMGGTTAKMTYISDGQVSRARTFEVARVARFQLGSGLPVQVPVIEMIEIGAGGGSIAYKDKLGLLKVGPESSGADPGPACYGLGGTKPTVTDVDLVLGYLSPENFLGGEMRLHTELAREAIRSELSEPLGLDLIEAARGVYDVVNQNMVAATKVHVAEKGRDPRSASLVAFGGAGPIHAHAIARSLGLHEVICPLRAGTASALGFLTAPIAFEFARSLASRVDTLDARVLAETFATMESLAYETLRQAGIERDQVSFRRSTDMRHVGQGHEIEVLLPPGAIDAAYVGNVPGLFYEAYDQHYGQTHMDVPIEMITCRLVASGPEPSPSLSAIEKDPASVRRAHRGTRPAYFQEAGGFVETTVYDRYSLRANARLQGPAIVEERESTVIVPPGMNAEVDLYGNLIIQVNGHGTSDG